VKFIDPLLPFKLLFVSMPVRVIKNKTHNRTNNPNLVFITHLRWQQENYVLDKRYVGMQHPMVMMTKLTVLDSIVSSTCSSVNVLATYNSALGVNEAMVIVVTHHQLVYSKPYRWCEGKRDCIESWVDREFEPRSG
jgi:hypothetical protein